MKNYFLVKKKKIVEMASIPAARSKGVKPSLMDVKKTLLKLVVSQFNQFLTEFFKKLNTGTFWTTLSEIFFSISNIYKFNSKRKESDTTPALSQMKCVKAWFDDRFRSVQLRREHNLPE